MVEEDGTRYWESGGAVRKQFVPEYSLFLIAKHYGRKGQKHLQIFVLRSTNPGVASGFWTPWNLLETKSEQGGGFWLTMDPSFAVKTDSQK